MVFPPMLVDTSPKLLDTVPMIPTTNSRAGGMRARSAMGYVCMGPGKG